MFNHSNKKKEKREITEEEKKQEEKIRNALKKFKEFLILFRKNEVKKTFEELYEYSNNLIKIMEDVPSVINFRQDLIKLYIKENKFDNEEKIKNMMEFFEKEFKFISKITLQNPKSYQLWFHRIFLFNILLNIDKNIAYKIIQKDILMVIEFLKKDSRNFHAWNYRNHLITILWKNFPEKKDEIIKNEFKYFNLKIEEDFSNYSSLHFKSKYYEIIFNEIEKKDIIQKLSDEFNFIKDGLFLSEKEQSLWIYLRWIIKTIFKNSILYINKFDKKENIFNISFLDKNICQFKDINLEANNLIIEDIEFLIEDKNVLFKDKQNEELLIKILDYLNELKDSLEFVNFNLYYLKALIEIYIGIIKNKNLKEIVNNLELKNDNNNFFMENFIKEVENLKNEDNFLDKLPKILVI